MPNLFAYFVLFVWPIVALLLSKKIKSLQQLIVYLWLIPYLFLPVKVEINLPLLPSIDKNTIAGYTCLLILLLYKQRITFPRSLGKLHVVVLICVFSSFFTVLTNQDSLNYGGTILPALSFREFISISIEQYLLVYLPFLTGYLYFKNTENVKVLLHTIVILGLVYSVLVVWESRMSPQLHSDFYGFFPHDFGQQKRMGGFRSTVFLGHGLLVAVFMAHILCSVAVLVKSKAPEYKSKGKFILGYAFFVVILTKTVSAWIYSMLGLFTIFLLKPRVQLTIALVLSAMVFTYPILRTFNIMPVDSIVELAREYSEERAQSLEFRIKNENKLLDKANERILFGWGEWGRNFQYNEFGFPNTVDGMWVALLGKFGIVGYLSLFFIISFPIWLAWKRQMQGQVVTRYVSGLSIILTLNLVDLIPNASITTITFLIAGVILGSLRKENNLAQKNTT